MRLLLCEGVISGLLCGLKFTMVVAGKVTMLFMSNEAVLICYSGGVDIRTRRS